MMDHVPHYPVTGEMKKQFNAFLEELGIKSLLENGEENTLEAWIRFVFFLADQESPLAKEAADMAREEVFKSFQRLNTLCDYANEASWPLFGGREKVAEALISLVGSKDDVVKLVVYNECGVLTPAHLPKVLALLQKYPPEAEDWFHYSDLWVECSTENDCEAAQCIANYLMGTTAPYQTWVNILRQLPILDPIQYPDITEYPAAAAVLRQVVLQKLLRMNEPLLAP